MRRALVIVILGILSSGVSGAGGHLNSIYGMAVRYKPAITGQPLVIPFSIDQGSFGTFDNTTAAQLTRESFQVWQDVATAAISFSDAGSLSEDVGGENFEAYFNNSDGINPIIFDHDGSIIDGLYGSGSSNGIIGFAGSGYFTSGPNVGTYAEGYAVMNGTMAGTRFSYEQFKSTFIHEFGHFIGLDHSQINKQFVGNFVTQDDAYIPTMFPTSTDDDTYLADLNVDDILAVSRLYPGAGFPSGTGTIKGTVARSGGSLVPGVNVVAIRVTDSLSYQVSTVTDYLNPDDSFTFNWQATGSYVLSGLAPGDYWVRIEPVNPAFFGASGVGPFASSSQDKSLQNPVPLEYYNGSNESADTQTDLPDDRVVVTVAGDDTTVAPFIVNGAAIPVAAPTTIIGEMGYGEVTISWTPVTLGGLVGYQVFGDTVQAPTNLLSSTTGTSATITGLQNDIPHFFRVAAEFTGGVLSPYTRDVMLVPGNVIQYFENPGSPGSSFLLPSRYADTKYAVRFTPGAEQTRLTKTDFLLYHTPFGVRGAGNLMVSVHEDAAGPIGGLPGAQIGSSISVPFSSLEAGVFNAIDLSSLNITVLRDVSFHIVFEVAGSAGDTVVFRGDAAEGPTNRSSSFWDAGAGPQWYNFIDENNWGEGYNLMVRAYLDNLTSVGEEVVHPDVFSLEQNYPNPFNPSTVLPFTLDRPRSVTLEIFDMLGRRVSVLIDGKHMQSGRHSATFDASNVPSGMYVALLTSGGRVSSRRMVLIR